MTKKYVCDKCDMSFTRQAGLSYHVEKNACKEKNIKCKFCDAPFVTKISMYRHIRTACKTKKREDKQKEEIYERLLKLEEEIKKKDTENVKKIKELEKTNKNLAKEIKNIKTCNKNNINNVNNGVVNNGIVNNNNNTINQNIILVGYGNED